MATTITAPRDTRRAGVRRMFDHVAPRLVLTSGCSLDRQGRAGVVVLVSVSSERAYPSQGSLWR
jgi:hypothetical protein